MPDDTAPPRRNRLLELIGPHGIVVADGAMGTILYSRGVFVNRSFDELNISQPELVRGVHAEYVAAGADLLETNTFSANRFKLAAHGMEAMSRHVNEAGALIAREAAAQAGDRHVLVAGAIGPLGVRIEPWGSVSVEEAQAAFAEQAEALLEGGVDLFVLETFYHLPELHQAVRAVRSLCDLPIVAQVSVTEEATTAEGLPPALVARSIAEWDVDGVGVNCGTGPIATLEAIEAMGEVLDLPLSAMPNAGQPRNIHGRNIYLTSPDYLASYARRFIKAGARIVGGCCGTTPEHIRAIKGAVVAARPASRPAPARPTGPGTGRVAHAVARAEKSNLARRLAEGSFPVCVRVLAPRGWDPTETLDAVRALKRGGVDLIAIPEGQWAARLPALVTGQVYQREVGDEAIVDFSARQRTLLRIQSELLGAYTMGLKNLVLVTGAPPALGEHPDATAGLEVDSIGLTNMVHRLNQGIDVAGRPLGKPTAFHVGVFLDPFAPDLEHEVRRFEWKVDAGAEFAITATILDVKAFAAFLPRIAHCRIPIVASVPVVSSYREAERLRRETGAGKVPQEVVDELLRAEKDGREAEVGLQIAIRTAQALRPLVEGVQIQTPEGRHLDALKLVEALKGSATSAG